MFKKILIANRGEIACRIMRTARRMGIATVAVYSDADAGTPHVMMADEAVHIGGAASADSYLRGERIIAAAKETGAEAIHPGFGFLSENAGFVAEVEAAGLVFIGPGTKAIAVMGDKIESKALAKSAGVSTVPGTEGEVDDVEVGLKAAAEIGYPVMVKASAGGGGKGMRVIESADDLPDGMRAAMSEAQTAFGDSRVFIEKFVVQPRHIEIQLLADQHGNIVYVGERECSIQRRHQKIVEETPAPGLAPALRDAIEALHHGRWQRAEEIDRRLAAKGMPGALQGARAVQQELGDSGNAPARPHFAEFLVRAGHVRDRAEAFRKWLGSGKLGDVKQHWPTLEETLATLRSARAWISLAHPWQYDFTRSKRRRLVADFAALGGHALEVVNGMQPAEQVGGLAILAREFGLMASVGSDFHAPGDWSELGMYRPLPDDLTALWERFEHAQPSAVTQ